jgi:Domain of unknown function (DUF4260)
MTGSASQIALISPPASPPAPPGVTGGLRTLLRLEGLAAGLAALALYAHADFTCFSWPLFALLGLAPDFAMLGYLVAGPRTGALAYNAAHSYVLALALTLAGHLTGSAATTAAGLIWLAHVGFDRALGYGLKYPTGFHDTHLGRLGPLGRIGRR